MCHVTTHTTSDLEHTPLELSWGPLSSGPSEFAQLQCQSWFLESVKQAQLLLHCDQAFIVLALSALTSQ